MTYSIDYNANGIIEYCRLIDVCAFINVFSTDNNGNYIYWGMPLAPNFIQSQVDRANITVTSLIGNVLSSGAQIAGDAHNLATDIATLRTIVLVTGGWINQTFNYSLGDLNVQKGTAAYQALQAMTATLKSEIEEATFRLTAQAQVVGVDTTKREYYAVHDGPLMY